MVVNMWVIWYQCEAWVTVNNIKVIKLTLSLIRTSIEAEQFVSLQYGTLKFFAILSPLTKDLTKTFKANVSQHVTARRLVCNLDHFGKIWFFHILRPIVDKNRFSSNSFKLHINRRAMTSWKTFLLEVLVKSFVKVDKTAKT